MKTRKKIIIGLSLGLAAALSLGLAACAQPDTTIKDLLRKGYNVIVEYDVGDGLVASRDEMSLKDFYRYEDIERGIKLIAPGDPNRGGSAESSTVSRSGYFLIGWYGTRDLRVDEEGKAVDENGELCSESKLDQGYTYGARWEFGEDLLTTADVTETTIEGYTAYTITLYAAWSPNFTYALYRESANEAGEKAWVQYGSANKPTKADSIPVPAWSEETGGIAYGNIPAYYVAPQSEERNEEGAIVKPAVKEQHYSMTGLYADPALTQPYADNDLETTYAAEIVHTGSTDIETGTSTGTVVRLYTTWREGLWYHIYNAKSFSERMVESSGKGNFFIEQDFSFVSTTEEGKEQIADWGASNMTFTGMLDGQNHTVTGIHTKQAGSSVAGGVFASIGGDAVIKDITFADVDFTLTEGTRLLEGYYGLLAGTISAAATDSVTLTNVAVSGTIHLGKLINSSNYTNYTIGLVCGNVVNNSAVAAISNENVNVVVDKVNVRIDEETFDSIQGWAVTATIDREKGVVNVAANENDQSDPNPIK